MAFNPDMQSTIPHIMQLLDQVHSGQQQLLQLWQMKKSKLDQCYQLRLFEQDCEKMFDWIYQNRGVFISNYIAVGRSFKESKKLQEDHNHFTMGSNVRTRILETLSHLLSQKRFPFFQNVFANINRILSEAAKLIESNHYASPHIRSVASRLDKSWKDFASTLDEKTTVLALSVLFHQKVTRKGQVFVLVIFEKRFAVLQAEQYGENVPKWSTACDVQAASAANGGGNNSTDISGLESSIHHHQTLYESMCQAYTEVHSTSKKLLYQLDHLVTVCSAYSQTDQKSYMEQIKNDPNSEYSIGK